MKYTMEIFGESQLVREPKEGKPNKIVVYGGRKYDDVQGFEFTSPHAAWVKYVNAALKKRNRLEYYPVIDTATACEVFDKLLRDSSAQADIYVSMSPNVKQEGLAGCISEDWSRLYGGNITKRFKDSTGEWAWNVKALQDDQVYTKMLAHGILAWEYKSYLALEGLIAHLKQNPTTELEPVSFVNLTGCNALEYMFILLYMKYSPNSVTTVFEESQDLFYFDKERKPWKDFYCNQMITKGEEVFVGEAIGRNRDAVPFQEELSQALVNGKVVCATSKKANLASVCNNLRTDNSAVYEDFFKNPIYLEEKRKYETLLANNSTRLGVYRLKDLDISDAGFYWYAKQDVYAMLNSIVQSITVVLDTESTGLHVASDKIMEFAGIKMDRMQEIADVDIYRNIQSVGTPNQTVANLTGITASMLREKGLPEEEFKQQLLSTIDGADWLVAYNSPFDIALVSSDMNIPINQRVFDLLDAVRLLYPGLESYKLGLVAQQLGVEGINSHNALDDVKLTLALLRKVLADTATERAAVAVGGFPCMFDFPHYKDISFVEVLYSCIGKAIEVNQPLRDKVVERLKLLAQQEVHKATVAFFVDTTSLYSNDIRVETIYTLGGKQYDWIVVGDAGMSSTHLDFLYTRARKGVIPVEMLMPCLLSNSVRSNEMNIIPTE